MYKGWFHMELIINNYVMGKGGTQEAGYFDFAKHQMQVPCLLHLWVGLEVGIFSHGWISHFCTPFSNASAHQSHTAK